MKYILCIYIFWSDIYVSIASNGFCFLCSALIGNLVAVRLNVDTFCPQNGPERLGRILWVLYFIIFVSHCLVSEPRLQSWIIIQLTVCICISP